MAEKPKKKAKKAKPKAKKEPKNKGGRPKININYEQLDQLCKFFCTGEECSAILGMSYDTLNRCLKRDGHGGFADYFEIMSAHGKASIRRTQMKVAVQKEDVQMLKHLGNQYLGQSDKSESTVKMESEVKIGLDSLYDDVESND